MVNLDIRLKAVYDLTEKCDTFLDVGSDHGYLPLHLIKNNIINKAVVSDINEGPLFNAKENFELYKMRDKATFILTGGLRDIDTRDIDAVSICGMGGELIISILEEDKTKAKGFDYLIFQPMNSVNLVRKYLYENGYTIVKEDLVKDRHHFYNILKVIPKKDNREFDEIFFDLGYDLFKEGNENFIDFINYKIRVNKKIIENCKSQNSENAKRAKEKAVDYINRLEGVKKDYESKRCNRVY